MDLRNKIAVLYRASAISSGANGAIPRLPEGYAKHKVTKD